MWPQSVCIPNDLQITANNQPFFIPNIASTRGSIYDMGCFLFMLVCFVVFVVDWRQSQQPTGRSQQTVEQVAQQQQQYNMWVQSQEPKAWLNSPERAQSQQQQEVWPQSRQQIQMHQQVSSTINNGTSPSQSSLKFNDSQKSSEDSFLSESPHTSELVSSKDVPGTTSADRIDQPCQPLVCRSTDHPAKQRDPQLIDSPDIPIMPVQCTEEVTEHHFVMSSGRFVIIPYGEYQYQPAPYGNQNEQTLENSKPSQPNPDEEDSVELSTHPHSHTEGLIGGPPQDPVPNDPHGNNKGSELSTGNSHHHNSSHGVAGASLPGSTHPVSSNPSVSLSASTKDILEKDSVTKSPSQSEVVVEKTFEHTLLPEHTPSTSKISLPGYVERSLSSPQARNSSSPRPSTYGGDEKFDKPIQPPKTTMTTTTTTLSQQQQVSSTISNGMLPPQLSLKPNDSQKSSKDSFLSESPHTLELASSKDDPGTTSADTMDQPSQPLVNASVDPDSRDHNHSSFHTRTKRSFDNTMDSEESGTSPTIHQKPVPVSNGSKPVQPNSTETGNSDTLPTTQTGSMEHVHPRSNTDEERENSIQAQLSLQPSVSQHKNKPSPSQMSPGSSDPHSLQTQWSMSPLRPPKPVHQPQQPPSSSVLEFHPNQQSAPMENDNNDNDVDDDDDARSIVSGSSILTSIHTGNTDLPLGAQQQQNQVGQLQPPHIGECV